jgi:CobQ-like glutamine amidotransferase family enzyme
MKRKLTIAHLYATSMNLYGDTGNVVILQKRAEWRGIACTVIAVNEGDPLPKGVDIIVAGGGQDATQGSIESDFLSRKAELTKLVGSGCVMLMICGMYQLMGRKFVTQDGVEVTGLGILPIDTFGKPRRLIGNIVVDVEGIGRIVGYENHSGQTVLDEGAVSLGTVEKGYGNTEQGGQEGCRKNNVFGTYMHGPVLSKNPLLADELLSLALERQGNSSALGPLDDSLENTAHKYAMARPR